MLRWGVGKALRELESIKTPADLRALPRELLPRVAAQLREELVEIGSAIGGHFAGSLGVVELSVALHYVFETPRDRLVWDVGHQAYGHKALTGRREWLWQVKRSEGPSGFLRRSESEYDTFGAGHAGTSVSAALGIAEAQRLRDDDGQVVAIIGDGASTAGMSFEAFNHAGGLDTKLRVVLNDNGMSIAPNVGGLARTRRVREYLEALGLDVIGPVDGHDLEELLPALESLRGHPRACVLHVETHKGHGYAPAEADPFRWHATSPFEVTSGERRAGTPAPPSWTRVFADALSRLADRDPRLVAITAAMPDGTGLDRFALRHPERVYDVGISEQHAVTFAAGLATEGLRPVCAIYSSFLQRAFDQIVHDVALQGLPVVFALDRAGLVGADGPTHHGTLDIAYLRVIPNLVIAAPRDENQLQHLLATGLESDKPFALRFPRGASLGVELDEEPRALPVGKGECLREGNDIALIALGKAVGEALAAAELLETRGISACVVDARFVKPLDGELLARVARQTGAVLTVEDHVVAGGFGSAVCEFLGEHAPGVRLRCLGLPDAFVEHGETSDQWRQAGIDSQSVAEQACQWLTSFRGDPSDASPPVLSEPRTA